MHLYGRLVVLSLLGLAPCAWAADASLRTEATSLTLDGEFRDEFYYDKHKFDQSPTPGVQILAPVANLRLLGNINKDTELRLRSALAEPSQLEYGYATHRLSKIISFSIGR